MTDAPSPKGNQYGNLPGNSKKKRENKPEIKPVEGGTVVSKGKQSLGRRIQQAFTGDDSKTVGNYVFFDVVLPAVKQLISDALSTGIERLLFGGDSRGGGARRGYTSYNRYSQASRDMAVNTGIRGGKPESRAVHNFDDIVLDNRGAAEQVIDQLAELISTYEVATVSDFYQMVRITGTFQDDKWGWTSMVGARVDRVRDGYLIRLPRTEYLD